MSHDALIATLDAAWEARDTISVETQGETRQAVDAALALLDSGTARVAEPGPDGWRVNQWLKKAVLLSFRLNPMEPIPGGPGQASLWYDKVPSKFEGWGPDQFDAAGFRAVPNCAVRRGSFLGKGVVVMPSFVNLGAYVGEGTMIDSFATVGSCAQIGAHCHISAGVTIAGVLEPLQADPVIIEDNCFVGVNSCVAEGMIVGEGAVIAMGVYLGQSTKIIDRATGESVQGKVPPYSVVVPGVGPSAPGAPATYCAVIVKRVDERTRAKTSVNELLRN